MQRDMSYELDDSFSTRNAGELVRTMVPKTRVMRTPGLRVLAKPQIESANVYGSDFEQLYEGTPVRAADGLAGITLPGVGAVDLKSAAIGAVVGVLAGGMILKLLRGK